MATFAADDHDELDLPVDVARRELDVTGRSGQARGELGEDDRLGRQVEAGLRGVGLVVQADREHLPRPWHDRPDPRGVEGLATVRVVGGGPLPEVVPLVVERLRVGAEPPVARGGDVNGAAVRRDDGGATLQVRDAHGVGGSGAGREA